MRNAPKLLVVDDERVVCDSCARIFHDQGFAVETCNSSSRGLDLATSEEFAAILLDIKMPEMDGIEFLEALRKSRRDVPVIMITGYSTVQSAAAAMRLGASDYVSKPFTPDEITTAVRRLISPQRVPDTAPFDPTPLVDGAPPVPVTPARTHKAVAPVAAPVTCAVALEDIFFLDESWARLGEDGTARVGAFLPREEARCVESVWLPRVGEQVAQGLPLASLATETEPWKVIVAPVSGQVIEINETLRDDPATAFADPCQTGWIARIRPTALERELRACRTRNVIVASADAVTAARQRYQLAYLGCCAREARTLEEIRRAVDATAAAVVLVDAVSYGLQGPTLVADLRESHPGVRIVVIGEPGSPLETAYRRNGLFYYAVEPFADGEIVDILESAFRPPVSKTPDLPLISVQPQEVGRIRLTTRNRERVSLLVEGEFLQRHKGLGRAIVELLNSRALPVTVDRGARSVGPKQLEQELDGRMRVVILRQDDMDRIPGCLQRVRGSDLLNLDPDEDDRVVTLIVQPHWPEGSVAGLDARTTNHLARHIVRELAGD